MLPRLVLLLLLLAAEFFLLYRVLFYILALGVLRIIRLLYHLLLLLALLLLLPRHLPLELLALLRWLLASPWSQLPVEDWPPWQLPSAGGLPLEQLEACLAQVPVAWLLWTSA